MKANTQHAVALVTNVDADIGLAVVNNLLDSGYTRIMLAAKTTSGVRKAHSAALQHSAAKEVQLEMHDYKTDTYEDVERLISQTVDLLGDLNVAINCLSMLPINARPTAEIEAREYKDGLNAGSREIWLLCKAQSTYFISQQKKTDKGGSAFSQSILNIIPFGNIGITNSRTIQAASSYSSTGITKSLARDVKPYGIRVNAVCPGITDSKEDQAVATANEIPQKENKAGDRPVKVEEVAKVAVFVAGPGGSGMTGVAVPVDFGWCLTHA